MKHVYQSKLHVYCSGCLQEYGKNNATISELKELGFTEINSISYNSEADGYTVTISLETESDGDEARHIIERMARCRLAKPNRFAVESFTQLS